MDFLGTESTLMTFDVDGLDEYLDVSCLRMFHYGVQGARIAVATLRHLLVMEGTRGRTSSAESSKLMQRIQIANFLPEHGCPMCLLWLIGGVLCVGFDSGYVVCFDDSASVISENRFGESPIVSMQIENASVGRLWLMFENGICVSAPVTALIEQDENIEGSLSRFRISEQRITNDFLFMPSVFHYLFDGSSSDALKKHMIVAGTDKSLSVVDVGGGPQRSHLTKPVTPKKEKSRSFFSSLFGSSAPASPSSSGRTSPAVRDAPISSTTELSPLITFDDQKRRMLRVSVDPSGRLVATADTVGRVMLFDMRIFAAIRIWKGLREARLAWTEGVKPDATVSSSDASASQFDPVHAPRDGQHAVLCLAIYSPMTGLCNLWTMKHGPCLRSIPVGPQCFIYTVYANRRCGLGDIDTERSPSVYAPTPSRLSQQNENLTTCVLLMHCQGKIILSSLTPFGKSKGDLDAHKFDLMLDLEHEGIDEIESDCGSRSGREVSGHVGEVNATGVENHFSRQNMHSDYLSSWDQCQHGIELINTYLEIGLVKVQHILDTNGCCSGVLRNDSPTHADILMRDLEKKILPVLAKISSVKVAFVCLSLVDSFERDALRLLNSVRCGIRFGDKNEAMPNINGKGLSPAAAFAAPSHPVIILDDKSALITVGSSYRWLDFCFTVDFHMQLVEMMSRCGRDSGNYGILMEIEIRTRLLKAYQTLYDINAAVSVQASLSTFSDDSSVGSTSSLMRYGEWRSEASRWMSRLHRLQVHKPTRFAESGNKQVASSKGLSATDAMHQSVLSRTPPPPGKSIDIINMSPSGHAGQKSFGDRPVLRKGFSFAEKKSNSGEEKQDHIGNTVMGPGIDSNSCRAPYVVPSSDTHRFTPVKGAVNCNPTCLHRTVQDTEEGAFLSSCPALPFGIFRAMHSTELCGDRGSNVVITFRSKLMEALTCNDGNSVNTDLCERLVSQSGKDSIHTVAVSQVVKLDNCLSFTRNADTGSVRKGETSLRESFINDRGEANDNYSSLLVSSASMEQRNQSIPNIGLIPKRIIENDWIADSTVMWDFLSFICTPFLFSDPFNLPLFSKALQTIGLGSGAGLYYTIIFLAKFVQTMPASVLINVYYNKPSVSVLMFRWMKEVLLDFFQFYSASEEGDAVDSEANDESMNKKNDTNSTTRFDLLHQLASNEGVSVNVLFPTIVYRKSNEMTADYDVHHEGRFNEKILTYPTFDEVIRVIFKPAWISLQNSRCLEHAMAFSSMVLDVFDPVCDQTERRSKGSDGLVLSKGVWERFLKQIRICLLLSFSSSNSNQQSSQSFSSSSGARSKSHAMDITVSKLASGEISIFRLLAEDTLCFAELPDQAVSHEQRCLEVSRRSSAVGSTAQGGSTLQAWGSLADSKWKELLAIVEAEDLVFAPESDFSTVGNSPTALPSNISLNKAHVKQMSDSNAAARKSGTTKYSNGESTTKVTEVGVTTSHKKLHRRRPLLILFSHHNKPEPLGAYRAMILAERWFRRPKKVDKLLLAADHLHTLPRLTRAIVAELVLEEAILPMLRTYLDIEDNIFASQGGRTSSLEARGNVFPVASVVPNKTILSSTCGQELLSVMSDAHTAKEIISASIDFFSYISEGNEALLADGIPLQTLDSVEEINVDLIQNYCEYIWPPTDDLRLNRLRRKYCARGGVLISTIDAHLALLCVLQLRTTCGLRGIRPSRLFGCDVIASLCSRGTLENSSIEIDMNGPSGESTVDAHWEEIRSVRSEFIVQCFRQLGSTRSATLYRLSALWLYSLHEVRIMHVNVLLELYLDELVDEMIPQIANFYAVVDCITEKIRRRLGIILVRLENLSGGIDLLPLVDPDAASWCKSGVSPPETAVLEAIVRGRSRIADFNLNSTKHLVIQIQALLLSVPSIRRDEAWVSRKQQCDALHGLCSFLFSPSAQGKLQRKGLIL